MKKSARLFAAWAEFFSIARLALWCFLLVSLEPFAQAQTGDVLTFHNDNGRTGQYLVESNLTPANVNSTQFGKLWVLNVDGHVDAEPLYAGNVSIPGKGVHNVVIVATEHDSVYAFDANSTNILWQVSMLGSGETAANNGCSQVSPEVGITATPVIDRQAGPNGTIFLVACTSTNGAISHRVHALDLATGTNRISAVTVTATFPGTGANSSGGNVIFDPAKYEDRPALLLLNGVIYTTWASHCDGDPYTGWIMGYDENTLAQTRLLNVTPNGTRGAIWMAGDGPAADTSSNIYFLDANGTFDPTLTANGFPISGDFGNGFLKISTTNSTIAVADYFEMSNTLTETTNDEDLGSGGEILLPGMTDTNNMMRYLGVGAGKDKTIYIVDTANMGKFSPNNNSAIYQAVNGALSGGVFSAPAYFNGTLYYGSIGDHLKAFPFQNARLMASSSQSSATFPFPGTTPSISANGNSNGIVWATDTNSSSANSAVLYAYNATNLAIELYDSTQAANSRDQFGNGNKYITPMIANGKVYVATTTGVGVFGSLAPSPVLSALAFTTQPGLTTNGLPFNPPPVVQTVDQFGHPITTGLPSVLMIQVTLTNGTGTLLEATTYNIGTAGSNGVVTLAGLGVNTPGTNYQLAVSVVTTAAPTNTVPGAVLWLDAADPTTLTTNATKVQAWKNKGLGGAGTTGTNLWFTQNTAGLQPTITYNALNGLPALTFSDNGSGEGAGSTYLGNFTQSYTNSGSQMTYFVVATESANTTENWRAPVSFACSGQGDGQGTNGVVALTDGSQAVPYPLGIQRNHPGTPMQATIPVPAANNTAFAMTFMDNAGTAILYYTDVNGNYQTNGANIVNGISPYNYGITEVTVGSRLEPPTGTVIDNGWNGDVAELLVYNTALSSSDRASVESYLKGKWFGGNGGISLSNAVSTPFTVQPSAPPPQKINSVTVNVNGSVTIGYATSAGYPYHVETTTNLASATWTTVPGSQTNAVGTAVTFTDTTSANTAARFYRVVSP